ncbi:DUF4124 domain-containing protein [Agitococcus lubricus]|uniref:Uncharacterized protein DUF4124 n=1 Tax=Agitococcus lubricus TaxID=1077255 RepID=A0A2T5J0Y9_9GAMM|nr:DUF4124 domain-containing protein [Agitococcus lubricus]PTQ90051.1 uncharacterized protein DUF4124 [Agitococcus lubricus]
MYSLMIGLITVLLATTTQAGIYKSYDKNGNVIYSDTGSTNAVEVEEKPVATMPALPRSVIEKKMKKPETTNVVGAPTSYQISIDKLKSGDTIQHGDEPFSPMISLDPSLWREHHLKVSLDGQFYNQDTFAPNIDPSKLERGQHRLDIKAVDKDGNVLGSTTVDFFVQQQSALKKKK